MIHEWQRAPEPVNGALLQSATVNYGSAVAVAVVAIVATVVAIAGASGVASGFATAGAYAEFPVVMVGEVRKCSG